MKKDLQNQPIKQINKTYETTLESIQKSFFSNSQTGLDLFVEYLRYIRDSLIIKAPDLSVSPDENLIIATIMAAIAEYESYENYKISKADERLQKFHWDNFWELIKCNLREWQALNDTI